MTIVASCVTRDGIVMAAESRQIAVSDEDLIGVKDAINSLNLNFRFVSDDVDKVYLIRGKYGLLYSGPSSMRNKGWDLQGEIDKLDRLVNQEKKSDIEALAATFNSQIMKALPAGVGYAFYLAGYQNGQPCQVCYADGRDRSDITCRGFRMDQPDQFPNGYLECGANWAGKINIINEFMKDREIEWGKMSLRDAVEAIEWLISVGINGLRFFKGEQPVSGGPVDILVLTPGRSGFVKHKKFLAGERHVTVRKDNENYCQVYSEVSGVARKQLEITAHPGGGGGGIDFYDDDTFVGSIQADSSYISLSGIGRDIRLTAGNVVVTDNLIPDTALTGNVGTVSAPWDYVRTNNILAGSLSATSTGATVSGDMYVSGVLDAFDKRCAEETSQGVVGLYVRESPDVRYVNEGRAELINGECKIDLSIIDPLFPECVELETEQSMWHIHVTPMGPFTPYVAEIFASGFIVKAKEVEANGKFTWSLSAVRKGRIGVRFPRLPHLESKIQEAKVKRAESIDPAPASTPDPVPETEESQLLPSD